MRSEGPGLGGAGALAAGVLAILGLPLLGLSDYAMRVATLTALYAVAATGWTLIGGFANQVSLGQATMFGIGGYVSTLLFARWGVTPWLGGAAGAALAALVAIALGGVAFRLRGHYFALITLALAEMVRIVVEYDQPLTGGAQGLSVPLVRNSLVLLQFARARDYYEIAALLLLAALALSRAIAGWPLGYELRAVYDDEIAAALAGVNVRRAKMRAFVAGAILTALAGTVYAQFTGFIDPDSVLSIPLSIQLALYAIVGGARTWWGPLAGAALLVPLGELMTSSEAGAGAGITKVLYGLILVAMVIVEPDGLAALLNRRRRGARAQA